jgi:hypothetical protein
MLRGQEKSLEYCKKSTQKILLIAFFLFNSIYIYSGCHRNRKSQIVPFLIFSEIPSVKNSQNASAESRGDAPKSGSNFREKQVFSETPLSKNSFSHSTAEKSTEKVDIGGV